METVLVAASRVRCVEIQRLFYPGRYAFVRAESEREARMQILDLSLSLVIVDGVPAGRESKDIAVFAASQGIDTLLVVSEEAAGHMAETMLKYGVYVAASGSESISTAVGVICVAKEKIRKTEEKNRKLLGRLKNEKLLTEAKCLLAAKKGLCESEAHNYIEKKAMNCRISLLDAAMNIVSELS